MTLQLHSDSSGLMHYLARKPVRLGDAIEVLVNRMWITVRYRWCGKASIYPYGVVAGDEIKISIMHHTQVRWPQGI